MSRNGRRVPRLEPGATRQLSPRASEAETNRALGFSEHLAEDWQARAVAALGEVVGERRSLKAYLESCMKCGACTDKCHYFLGSGDPLNMPVARQDLLRAPYKRYYTRLGRWLPWLVGAREFDDELLEQWFTYFHQCSQCRRCAVYCPVGIDTAEFSQAARDIMHRIGIGQAYTDSVVVKAKTLGNNLGLPEPALRDTLAGLEEEMQEDTGQAIRLPLDDPGAEIMLVTPSADFFAEPHIDGLMGYAKVFHQAGIRWTLSTHASEAANFALFSGSEADMSTLARSIVEAARALGVRKLVFGECGHAWRVAHNFLETLTGPLDFLASGFRRAIHIVEITHELMQRDALAIDPSRNDHRIVTFHDSCNMARASQLGSSPRGQFELPRAILRKSCNHFVDMADATINEFTYCCGAGGGLLNDEQFELRVLGSSPRMGAYQEVVERHGVTHMVSICAICKTQLSAMMPEFGRERAEVLSLHQVVGDALVF
jgi:Fe-S oxidoreductase